MAVVFDQIRPDNGIMRVAYPNKGISIYTRSNSSLRLNTPRGQDQRELQVKWNYPNLDQRVWNQYQRGIFLHSAFDNPSES
jgi:hypothetical protein